MPFIQSEYLYSASSSPLLLRGAPDYSTDAVSELTRRSTTGNMSEGLAQGPHVAARVGFEPATLRTHGIELTTEPPCSTPGVYSDTSIAALMPSFVLYCIYPFL